MTNHIDQIRRFALGLAAFVLATAVPTFAPAQNVPEDWQLNFGEPASPIMEQIVGFNNAIMILATLITFFVVGLLAWVLIRYRAKVNPVPTKTTHNTVIEILWTIVPVIILVGMAIPSFSLLFDQYDPARVIEDYDPEDALIVKVTGFQWSWSYEYPDLDLPFMMSLPVRDAEGNIAGEPRLLEATLPMVVPVDTVVKLQVTSAPAGVIHAFALPSMGVRLDAVPGRIVESWFLALREGVFYGQCSELCGRLHYAMPIELRVVSQEQFNEWAAAAAESPQAARELLLVWEQERLADQVAAR